MSKEKQKIELRNWKPIVIAVGGLAVLYMICICVFFIFFEIPFLEGDHQLFRRSEETQAPEETWPPSPAPGETHEPEVSVEPTEGVVSDESYERALEMAGEWEGMWINNTFGSSGAASLIIEVDPSGIATLTLDLDGFVFGMWDPDPLTYTANFGGGRIDFDVSGDPVFGDFLATGLADGTVSIEAELIPVDGIVRLLAEGSFAPRGIQLNYTVEFFGGGAATGELNLTRGP
jgi:hypothetical protein